MSALRSARYGWLIASVAAVFLLATGSLGYLLASSPRSAVPTAPAMASTAPARPPAGSANTASPTGRAAGAASEHQRVATEQRVAEASRRLAAMGYQVTRHASANDTDCAANAYGETRAYLGAHRCVGMHRALFDVRGADGGTAVVAVAWVDMPDASGATALKAVLDRPGSGNVTALTDQDSRYRTVTFNGRYYASVVQGDTVATAEAQPLAPGMSDPELRSLAAASVGAR